MVFTYALLCHDYLTHIQAVSRQISGSAFYP